MNRIALIGDTHFARKAEHPLVKKHIKDGQRKFFEFVVEELTKREIKTVLFTGDLHDTRNSINVDALVYTKRLLKQYMSAFDIHIIMGNHDMYYDNSYDVTALELFEDIPNVTVYREKVAKADFLGKQWYMFPWMLHEHTEPTVKFLEKLSSKSLKAKNDTVLFGHFELLGINMEGNSISTFGLDPNIFMDASNLVISGHYHGKSETIKSDSRLLYLGSPYPMTFANANQKHGIWILDEDLKYEFIENTISPNFLDIWDTDDLSSLKDLSNSFVRFFVSNDLTKEQEFALRLKVEKLNPILIRSMPYAGTKEEVQHRDEVEREANRILGMDTLNLSEIYIDQNFENLPKLSLHIDAKKAIMSKIQLYKETINA